MLYNKAYGILSEAASADLLDPAVDQEVKDVVEELQDELTTNVEEVPAEDKESNNAVLSPEDLKECCTLWEAADGSVVYADIRDIMRICEAEEEAGEPADAGEVAEDVAEKNDVDTDKLVIVAPVDVAEEIVENALMESKCGKSGKCGKKAKSMKDALKALKAKGIKVKAVRK